MMDETKRQKMIDLGMFPISRNEPKVIKLTDFDPNEIQFADFYDWVNVAYYIDLRELMKELPDLYSARRYDVWLYEKIDYWKSNGRWDLDVVRLIVVLYLHHQELRFVTGGLKYELINSVLMELAEQTDNVYQPRQEDREWVERRNQEEVDAFFHGFSPPDDEKDKTANADDDT